MIESLFFIGKDIQWSFWYWHSLQIKNRKTRFTRCGNSMREFKFYNLLNPAKTENKKRNYESRKVRLIKMKNNKNI